MKERILILAKTYPTFSKKYFELVCTAGINNQGAWRRIYPIPFRQLNDVEQYKKYQWVEVDIERNVGDPRPESYKIATGTTITSMGNPLPTSNHWQQRIAAMSNAHIFDSITEIIELANKKNWLSLCIFRPQQVTGFVVEECERNWPQDIIDMIASENAQQHLFDTFKKEIQLVRKLPYKFSYRFTDAQGKSSKLMIEDWEIGALYWNCLQSNDGDESAAIAQVEQKYTGFIQNNDLLLFLGTTRQYHGWAHNPFVIIGVWYPPKQHQTQLY